MVEIKLANEKKTKALLEKENIPYSDKLKAFSLAKDAVLLGHGIFHISGEIISLCVNAVFEKAMLKAILNYLDLKGVKQAVCYNPAYETLLLACKFEKREKAFVVNLDGYFDIKCEQN